MTASTRQVSHIRTTSSRRAFSPANIHCLPSSFATIRSTVLFVPKGVPQRMQWNGSSSFTPRRGARQAWKSSCGTTVMRSEEHTSELPSLMRISYDVVCLTKKNNNNIYIQERQRHNRD